MHGNQNRRSNDTKGIIYINSLIKLDIMEKSITLEFQAITETITKDLKLHCVVFVNGQRRTIHLVYKDNLHTVHNGIIKFSDLDDDDNGLKLINCIQERLTEQL